MNARDRESEILKRDRAGKADVRKAASESSVGKNKKKQKVKWIKKSPTK